MLIVTPTQRGTSHLCGQIDRGDYLRCIRCVAHQILKIGWGT